MLPILLAQQTSKINSPYARNIMPCGARDISQPSQLTKMKRAPWWHLRAQFPLYYIKLCSVKHNKPSFSDWWLLQHQCGYSGFKTHKGVCSFPVLQLLQVALPSVQLSSPSCAWLSFSKEVDWQIALGHETIAFHCKWYLGYNKQYERFI